MNVNTVRNRIRKIREDNRVALMTTTAVAATLVAVYMYGKSKGATTVEVNLISKDMYGNLTKEALKNLK